MTSPQKTAGLTDIKKDRYGYRDPFKIVPSGGWGSYPTKPTPAGTAAPDRFNRLAMPAWQPPPEPPRRPGADDHYRYKSRGH